jgi:ParB/RepB/Spo0J family partition protein
MALSRKLLRTPITTDSILNDPTLSTGATKNEINKVVEIPLNKIRLNDAQPRKHYDDEKIKALAESIQSEGLIQPIIVSQTGTRPVIIAGHRRYLAYKYLGKEAIPCIVEIKRRDHDDFTKLALIENLQREDLNSLELAQSLYELKEVSKVNQAELAKITGYAESQISKYLNVFKRVKDDNTKKDKLKSLGIKQAYNYYCNTEKRKKPTLTEMAQNDVIVDVNFKVKNNAESIENVLEDIQKLRKKLKVILKKLSR